MAFLSLSRGDPAARALLQRAIQARYGLRPTPVESLRLALLGQVKGLFGLPLRTRVTTTCVANTQWRWEQMTFLLGLAIGRRVESFDGGAYYVSERGRVAALNDPLIVTSFRRYLWALQALLLTPLTEEGVTLKAVDERTLQAMPDTNPDDIASIHLNTDDTLDMVVIPRYRLADQQTLPFMVKPTGGLQNLRDFVIPRKIVHRWENGAPLTFTVSDAEPNVKIPLTEFTMQPTR